MERFLRNPSRYIGAPGSQAFMQALQQPRPAVGPTIGALPPAPSVAIPRRPQPQAQRPLMPLEQAVMNQAMRQSPMAGLAQQQRKKTPAGGVMGMLPGIDTPGGAGLSAAAARGLQLSGYQDRPITTGQVLGEMAAAGMEAYSKAQAAETAERRANLADQLAMAELAIKQGKPIKKDIETFYTPEGGSYKAYYDPADERADEFGYVRLPGVKAPSGMSLSVDPETGEVTFTQGAAGAMQKSTRKNLETSVTDLTNLSMQLAGLDAAFKPEYLQLPTQAKNWAALTWEKITGESPENQQSLFEYTQFRARTQNVFSTVLKQLSGAAVTKFELDNAKTFLPAKEDSPTQFRAKLDSFRATTDAALYRAQNLLSGVDKITDDLARKYPLSITKGGQTLYIHQYVDRFLAANEGTTTQDALANYAEEARG